ncbi:MAG: CHASE3 domain-containing protein [Gemmatimonadales bacterium]
MKSLFDRGFIAGIAAVCVITAGNSALAYHNTLLLYQAAAEVTHTHKVLEALAELLSTAKDAETGQRGFVITGDLEYLRPYHIAEGTISEWIKQIDSLTADNPAMQQQLPDLRRVVGDKLAELRETVALRQNEGFAAAERMVLTGRGRITMDSIRVQVGRMVAEEEHQLRDRTAQAARSRTFAISALVIAGLVQLATLAALIVLLRRKIRNRERAAAQLHEQQEWFRTTLFSIGDAVITTDTTGVVSNLNPVAEALTGWSAAEARGHNLDDVFRVVHEVTRAPASNPALQALREGTVIGLANHSVLIARDGVEHPVDDSAAPIRDADGRVLGAVLVFRDISERREAESRLREADRRKDEFLAVLAHELRNPLAPLRHALEVLHLAPGDPASVGQVGGIMERQLQHMVRLIDDLMDVSRITSNRLELRRETIDIAAVVHGALETCGPLLAQSRHALKLTLPPHPLHVDADRARLAQAFANLLNNAIKYTEPGGRIWLTVERDGNEVGITVRDSGIGIPEAMLGRVFEMFVQVDSSIDRAQGGLGIGLQLVKRIVEMHGGSVVARSTGPGRGSEFVVRLPVALTPAAGSRPSEGTAGPAARRRVLVADDNADAADTLAMMLRMKGHEVAVARDGVEALEVGAQFQPEVAMLDIGMPKMDGLEVARRMRASDWGRGIMLIALTGWGQEDDRRRSRDAGFDHHIVKPVELATLEAVLGQPPRPPAGAN